MKVLLGLTVLDHGGAERVLVDLANKLVDYHDITILTLYPHGEFEHELNKKVKLKSIYNKKYEDMNIIKKKLISISMFFKFLRKRIYKKYVNDEYDINIAFLEGPITWILENGNTKKIAWVHNNINDIFYGNTLKKKLNYQSYLKYNKIIFVSYDNMEAFKNVFNINKDMEVIRNYIDINRVKELAKEEYTYKTEINFVQVSRLTKQKNVARLIKVHKKLIDDGYYHNIYVLGDGPLKDNLLELIKELKVTDTFHLLGRISNPYPYVKASDAFILTSIFEGYGMVVVEAKILNKPILITNTEAREAVEDYQEVSIVDNNENGIYNGLKELIQSNRNKKITYNYNNDDIIDTILNLIGDNYD